MFLASNLLMISSAVSSVAFLPSEWSSDMMSSRPTTPTSESSTNFNIRRPTDGGGTAHPSFHPFSSSWESTCAFCDTFSKSFDISSLPCDIFSPFRRLRLPILSGEQPPLLGEDLPSTFLFFSAPDRELLAFPHTPPVVEHPDIFVADLFEL